MLQTLTDGVVTLRPPEPGDSERIIAGRDVAWRRWLGPGTDDPRPTACIVVDGEVVGWIDFDSERPWLRSCEVNVGFSVFAPHRRDGYASRAVGLLLRHLDKSTPFDAASLLIDPENRASLAVAAKTRFSPSGEVEGKSALEESGNGHVVAAVAQGTLADAAVGRGTCPRGATGPL